AVGGGPDRGEDWRLAGPEVRAWVVENREALDLWRRGADRAGAPDLPRRSWAPFVSARWRAFDRAEPLTFARLAVLEGTRLEEAGDLDGAWGLYRAVVRGGLHVARRGNFWEHLTADRMQAMAGRALGRWAADPRIDAVRLRRALD